MIQIDMPMPDNCLECRFNTSEFGYCNAMPVEFVGQVNDFEEDGKPEWCPLKAQEPRVMTLYEVAKMAADFQDCMLWFEPKEVDDDMWFMSFAQPVESGETDIHIYEFGNEVPIEAKKYLYGKTWRCWTSRPTDAQREAIPWN